MTAQAERNDAPVDTPKPMSPAELDELAALMVEGSRYGARPLIVEIYARDLAVLLQPVAHAHREEPSDHLAELLDQLIGALEVAGLVKHAYHLREPRFVNGVSDDDIRRASRIAAADIARPSRGDPRRCNR